MVEIPVNTVGICGFLGKTAGERDGHGRRRFTSTVRPLESTIFVGTQLTPLEVGQESAELRQLDVRCVVQSSNGWTCMVSYSPRAPPSPVTHTSDRTTGRWAPEQSRSMLGRTEQQVNSAR